MPQETLPDMGRFKASVLIFKDYVERARPRAYAAGLEDYVNIKFHVKEFTKEDITHLAISPNGIDHFYTLGGIAAAAVTTDENGKTVPGTTPDAIQAQNALTYLKPDCCKSWKTFCNMITEVYKETKNERTNIEAKYPDKARRKFIPDAKPEDKGHGSIMKPHAADIALNPMEDPNFDHQKALAKVSLDATHDLKKPMETLITDAAKGLGNVRAA